MSYIDNMFLNIMRLVLVLPVVLSMLLFMKMMITLVDFKKNPNKYEKFSVNWKLFMFVVLFIAFLMLWTWALMFLAWFNSNAPWLWGMGAWMAMFYWVCIMDFSFMPLFFMNKVLLSKSKDKKKFNVDKMFYWLLMLIMFLIYFMFVWWNSLSILPYYSFGNKIIALNKLLMGTFMMISFMQMFNTMVDYKSNSLQYFNYSFKKEMLLYWLFFVMMLLLMTGHYTNGSMLFMLAIPYHPPTPSIPQHYTNVSMLFMLAIMNNFIVPNKKNELNSIFAEKLNYFFKKFSLIYSAIVLLYYIIFVLK